MSFNFSKKDDYLGLPPKIKKHFPVFVENRYKEFIGFKEAVEAGDLNLVRDYCHKQIGVASCYHCYKLEEITTYIQNFARSNDITAVATLVDDLDAYLSHLLSQSKEI